LINSGNSLEKYTLSQAPVCRAQQGIAVGFSLTDQKPSGSQQGGDAGTRGSDSRSFPGALSELILVPRHFLQEIGWRDLLQFFQP
jgi:hypothetical protein